MTTGRRGGESRRDRQILAALDFEVPCRAHEDLHAKSAEENNAGPAEVWLTLTSRECNHVVHMLVCGHCAVRYQQASRLTCHCGVGAPRSQWTATTRALPKAVTR